MSLIGANTGYVSERKVRGTWSGSIVLLVKTERVLLIRLHSTRASKSQLGKWTPSDCASAVGSLCKRV